MNARKISFSSNPDRMRALIKKGFLVLQLALTVTAFFFVSRELGEVITRDRWQWDFTTYYHAARAASADRNPYDTSAVSAVAGMRVREPFLYPPVSFYVLKPLSAPPYKVSYFIFLVLKFIALAGLIFAWVRLFPSETRGENAWIFLVSLCLAYRYAILWDIKAGNISVFEQFFLWSGLYLFTRRKSIAGAVSIALGSLFKFFLMAFAPLLLILRRSTDTIKAGIVAVLLFIAAHLASWLLDPILFKHFLSDARVRDEVGTHNPSSLAFFKSVVRKFDIPDWTSFLLYGLFVAAVLVCSVMIIQRIRRKSALDEGERTRATIAAYVIAYTLVAPRMKDYSYIIMLMPTLFVIRTAFRRLELRLLLYVLLWIPFGGYHPFLFSLGILLSMIWWVMRREEIDAPDGDRPSLLSQHT